MEFGGSQKTGNLGKKYAKIGQNRPFLSPDKTTKNVGMDCGFVLKPCFFLRAILLFFVLCYSKRHIGL